MDRFSLRVKLVAAVLVLVAGALAIVGVTTTTALHHYLIGRVDAQLEALAGSFEQQWATGASNLQFSPPADTGSIDVPSPYVVESFTSAGDLVDSLPRPLPADRPALGLADLRRSGPFSVPSSRGGAGGGASGWRVLVVTGPQGQRVSIANNLADADRVSGQLVAVVSLVAVGALVAVTVLGIWLVRVSMRPLGQIERAAAMIAGGDLTQRVPAWDPRTEVGRLGQSFNTMIERIERAFAAQAASEAAAHVSEARARRSEDKMRQFIADASHELRTPLTTIRGFAELYRQAVAAPLVPAGGGPAGGAADPERAADLVRRIEEEARRMGLLVEDLLLLARLDEERPLAVEPVDLIVLVNDAIEAARATAPDRTIQMELHAGGPLVVDGDEARLRQVITNLLGNALKHTPVDATVTVRLLRRDGQPSPESPDPAAPRTGPAQAVVEVADTGPGLTPEQAQRVFERFYRADPSRNRSGGPSGTGLGLAIVAAIVAAHRGRVEVDSTPGEGAVFRVLLPLPPDEPAA